MNRTLWNRHCHQARRLRWPCPSCGKVEVRIPKDHLLSIELPESERRREEEDWYPDQLTERFVTLALCSKCGTPVALCGSKSQEEEHGSTTDEDGDVSYESMWVPTLEVRYMAPAPRMIEIPNGLPKGARDQLNAAFAAYWTSPSACGNRVRLCLELLMDHFRIKRWTISRKGPKPERRRLNLHTRLELFGKKWPAVQDTLLAIKWVGNDASHDELSDNDALDGLELLEHVLEVVFDKDGPRRAKLVKEINRRKGARGARRTA